MPEWPDIHILAASFNQALPGRTLEGIIVNQPRCLNLPPEDLARALRGRVIGRAGQRGKWLLLGLDSADVLALNLGMGGEACLHQPEEVPDPKRERVVLRFTDGLQLWIHFWWFGHLHWLAQGDLSAHPQLARLGPEPVAPEFTPQALAARLQNRRGPIKKYLLDQSVIAGIGNVYIQDILWLARLHPLQPANTLTAEDWPRLHAAIRHVLQEGIRWGGGPREKDIWGREGHYAEHLQVGYRTGQPCPACGAVITSLRTGATTSYICPQCQRQRQGRQPA